MRVEDEYRIKDKACYRHDLPSHTVWALQSIVTEPKTESKSKVMRIIAIISVFNIKKNLT